MEALANTSLYKVASARAVTSIRVKQKFYRKLLLGVQAVIPHPLLQPGISVHWGRERTTGRVANASIPVTLVHTFDGTRGSQLVARPPLLARPRLPWDPKMTRGLRPEGNRTDSSRDPHPHIGDKPHGVDIPW